MAVAATKLRQHGLIVDLACGFVGWPDNQPLLSKNAAPEVIEWS
jgi:hypothetical protein